MDVIVTLTYPITFDKFLQYKQEIKSLFDAYLKVLYTLCILKIYLRYNIILI